MQDHITRWMYTQRTTFSPSDRMTYYVQPDGRPYYEAVAIVIEPDAEENARLIAAAPDLLDALQRIDRWAAAIEADPHAGLDRDFRELLKTVRAAIAKAQG
jgi:hypothetical protein